MTTTMAPAPIIPFRWVTHGLDVRAYLDGVEPLFNAADVSRALSLRVQPGVYDPRTDRVLPVYALPTVRVDGVLERDGDPAEFFTVDQVQELAAALPERDAEEFAVWFASILVVHANAGLTVTVLQPNMPAQEALRAGRTHSVRDCAIALSEDPALNYTQASLFDALANRLGWTVREGDVWAPTSEALYDGHLVRDHVPVGPLKILYPQIRVTPLGLTVLRERLLELANANHLESK